MAGCHGGANRIGPHARQARPKPEGYLDLGVFAPVTVIQKYLLENGGP